MEFSNQQYLFLSNICSHFHVNAEWPTYGYLDRQLKNHMDVVIIGRQLLRFMYEPDSFVASLEWDRKRQQTLGIAALYRCQAEGICPELKEDLDAFMHVVRLLLQKYDAAVDDELPNVTSSEACEQYPMSDLMLRKVYLLLALSNLVGTSSIEGDDGKKPVKWLVGTWPLIRNYRNVQTVEDYVNRRREIVNREHTRQSATYPEGLLDLEEPLETQLDVAHDNPTGADVFIVYGHDRGARHEVARYVENQLRLRAIMLDEIPEALTLGVFEAIEKYAASAGFAVVIMSPDDVGGAQGTVALHGRARQNVLIELGYFWRMLGRSRLVILKKGDVDIPSDFKGILYVEMDEPGAWREQLRGKISSAGLVK